MQNKMIRWITITATLLALGVVMLGAYTRLTDAGLGCPDWPGCYGQMVLPSTHLKLQQAQHQYPSIPIESRKAWTEMIHRYAAGTLAVFIFFIGIRALVCRWNGNQSHWLLPGILLILVIFQAALGMWTVTLKLLPVVVMGHLLGGILIFACLFLYCVQLQIPVQKASHWRPWLWLGALIILTQIALGGWVSSNYAGIACIGFPMCNGTWWPTLHVAQGFNVLSQVGANYQGGVLDNEVRVTIQFIHRIGALITVLYILPLSLMILLKSREYYLKRFAFMVLVLLIIQLMLGMFNVIYLLPLKVAVAHNGVAALLLATVLGMLHVTQRRNLNAC